ncbi:MAG: HAD family hydrolase [Tenericutes bacterium]|jgi:Cof subfamily protein (haloacid dehalogenase superfamily)|nr:HAD family hydrolase [Mycoplasmatota bacterium]
MALIFFDLDGTLLNNGQVVDGIPDIIDKLKKNGHTVALATGRNPNLLKGLKSQLNIEHMVLANGGYVLSEGEVIHERYIDFDTVKRLTKSADEYPFDLTIEYFDEYVAYKDDTKATYHFSEYFDLPIAKFDNKLYPQRPVFAVLVFEDQVVEDIKDDFPELQFNKSGGMAYDVNPTGDLKAEGVRKMIEHFNYDLEEVYAIGDNYNDVKMLKSVGHGVAMGNAVDELKDIAEYVTDDIDKQGVYKALKHYKLI